MNHFIQKYNRPILWIKALLFSFLMNVFILDIYLFYLEQKKQSPFGDFAFFFVLALFCFLLALGFIGVPKSKFKKARKEDLAVILLYIGFILSIFIRSVQNFHYQNISLYRWMGLQGILLALELILIYGLKFDEIFFSSRRND